ncbi:coiled-coil domain-containing protein 6-like isoform X1 [Polistes fuscatus]|uniref:Coiled-coil domain-containing protein 6 isoform X1 n=1 Tax=Polistes dominula TaxID=743375 RepID=A0ABM1IPK1_POLDO|nr:PREDICTED: coiled-coil domain-containing protein 6 isoform X1 [Polistes dominula]XP_043500014.1 coiled-coil domain-containing protein 6-like isoform X1 [Polistes fuscatus]
MADRDSASESDSSSIDGGPIMMPPSPISREQLQKRIESLQQHNRVLKVELETYKLRVKALQEENRSLRQASVIIQAKAEQEEEFISNTLLKKIQALKKEKETLAHHYEQEEECLTNDLSRKLNQLRQEKCRLEQTLEQEQECLVNKLMRKIEKLEAETLAKQSNLDQLRREKVELENTLEQEQEALVNKLWKRMDKLEAEKRMLQIKLDQPVSDPTSPREINNGDTATNLSTHIQTLRSEVARLRHTLLISQQEHTEKMQRYVNEEKQIREENLRLQRKLQLEVERREALCRHLSESESSLEMEEERHYNEIVMSGGNIRSRTVSSPIPYNPSPSSSRPLSPGNNVLGSVTRENFNPNRCYACGQPTTLPFTSSSPPSGGHIVPPSTRRTSDRFVKPAIPPTIVNPGGPQLTNPSTNTSGSTGSPMDITKT